MKSVVMRCLVGLIMLGVVACKVQKYPPELWKPTPAAGTIGQDIALQGAQFGDNPTVTFTATPVSGSATLSASATTVTVATKTKTDDALTLTVPRFPIGVAQVRVSNDQGITDPVAFTVLQPMPVLTAITPGNALPGAIIRLTGDYLDQLVNVKFGASIFYPGPTSSLTLVNAQTVDLMLPTYIPRGPQAVSIETVGGTTTSSFIVSGTPEITGIAPKRIKVGAELVIQGKNLTDGIVRINGVVTDKTLTSFKDTEIRTIVPATATSGKVTVTVFDKLVATSADSLFVVGAPVLAPNALTVVEGVKGDVLPLTGTGFLDVTSVTVGDTPATFRIISNTLLEVTVPDRPTTGAVPITVTSLGGSSTTTQAITIILLPAGLTVDLTRQVRGKDIIIRGQNLNRITAVNIGGRLAVITSRTEGLEVRATVPPDATTGAVTVTNRAGTVTAPKVLTVVLPPTITDFTKKALVGNRVVIKGTFLLNAQIYFSGNNYPALDDGKNEDGERWVVVTGDAQTGPIRVVNDAGEISTAESFTVLKASTITDFSPKTAKVGATITVTGQNLGDVTEVRFSGGKSSAATITLKTATSLTVTVPTDATDGTLCLTSPAGIVCTTATFTVAK